MTAMTFVITCLSGYAEDLIMDFGNGDSIRFAGSADNFDCDDPAYANVKKVRTWTMAFADGSTMSLCAPEGSRSTSDVAPPPSPTPYKTPANDSESHKSTAQGGVVAIYNLVPSENAMNPILHAIGVYQARRKEIVVNVSDDTRPIVLALSAYEATHWRIKPEAGVIIEKIILSGYHTQRVSGVAATVPIETYTYEPSPCGQCLPLSRRSRGTTKSEMGCSKCLPDVNYFYSYREPPKELKEITGLDITSFQGRYEGSEFSISHRVK